MRYGKDKAQKFLQYLLLQSTTIVSFVYKNIKCSTLGGDEHVLFGLNVPQ
jgi:hypothetical protein